MTRNEPIVAVLVDSDFKKLNNVVFFIRINITNASDKFRIMKFLIFIEPIIRTDKHVSITCQTCLNRHNRHFVILLLKDI